MTGMAEITMLQSCRTQTQCRATRAVLSRRPVGSVLSPGGCPHRGQQVVEVGLGRAQPDQHQEAQHHQNNGAVVHQIQHLQPYTIT